MRVAGLGFRGAATFESLNNALEKAGGQVEALATAETKAGAPAIRILAKALELPLLSISRDRLSEQVTLTQSEKVAVRFGTGSVAEAAALAAAGEGAWLLGPRVISDDGLATAAIAEREDRK
ncbi:MAG: cobalamin biosynthesis protein [Paracoccaceae bacterium]|jgi:cobalt-precorrin 5A hydrolase